MPTHASDERALHDAQRDLLDTAIESSYAAAVGDITWTAALAAIARALGVDRAILYTPERAADAGGLWAIHENTAGACGSVHAVGSSTGAQKGCRPVYSVALGDRSSEHPAALFVLFARDSQRFGHGGPEFAEQVRRHIALAVRLWFRGQAPIRAADVLAQGLTAGVVLADGNARIAWMNRRAQAWLQEGKLAVTQGQLMGVSGIKLDVPAVVREACEGRACILGDEAGDCVVEVVPVRSPDGKAYSVLLLLRDRATCRSAAAGLARRFRLTPAETDLAMALWKGRLLAEYADQRSVAMSTARTQLKMLLEKTGSRRQSDVVALVARMQPLLESTGVSAASGLVGMTGTDPVQKY